MAPDERPPPAPAAPRAGDPLWFLSDRDELLRRFMLRTLLQPPRFGRVARPRWLRR